MYSQENSMGLPTITPPSPTAFQMTQYGDVSINESTGNINPSIPIYTYKAGRLTVPISMSFQGNGVKVDQAASWTGVNWNLNAGGVITRTVRDLDDFESYSVDPITNYRNFYSYQDLNNLGASLTTDPTTMREINIHCTSDGIDSEVDIFSFSFPGYSGSFYLDENMKAHLTKNDSPLRIEVNLVPPIDPVTEIIQQYKREIIITTPDGVKYYFGGLTASEQSKTTYLITGGGQTLDSQTSFYLHKIEHPFGDEIILQYKSSTYPYQIHTAVSQSQPKIDSSDLNGCSGAESTGALETPRKDIIYNKITNGKFLSRIYSSKNNYEVIFNSNDANVNVKTHYTKILKNIEITERLDENTTNLIKEIKLDYIFPYNNGFDENAAQRFFLEKVKFYDNLTIKDYEYSMVYNHPEDLPERFSYDQDHLGYYNNKNNSSHLPQNDHPRFANMNGLADKNPDFFYASKGVLTHLYYPTGGYTKFEYDTDTNYQEDSNSILPVNLLTYRNDYTRNPVNKNPNWVILGQPSITADDETGEYTIIENIIADQTIAINMTNVFTAKENGSNGFDSRLEFILKVEDLTDDLSRPFSKIKKYAHGQAYPSSALNNFYYRSDGAIWEVPDYTFTDINLKRGHKYKISLEIKSNTDAFSGYVVSANLRFNYNIVNDEVTDGLGIRINKVSNYVNDNDLNPQIKKHYYSSPNKGFVPQYIRRSKTRSYCSSGLPGSYVDYNMVTLISSSLNSLYANSSNQRMYRKVRVSYGGNDYENGGVEREFLILDDALPLNYLNSSDDFYSLPNIRENKSTLNGTLKKETIFSKEKINNEHIKLKETENYYSYEEFSAQITNNNTSKLFNVYINSDTSINNLYLGLYNTYSNKIELDSTKTKTFDYSKLIIPDIDNDGIPDIIDNDSDANGNGIADGQEDFDGNGLPNSIDSDDDGDGVPDLNELALLYQPGVLETKTAYEYYQHPGLPTKVTSYTSHENISNEKHFLYPPSQEPGGVYDPTDMTSFSVFGNISSLIENNQISTPLQTEIYKNEGESFLLLSSSKTIYADFNGNSLPKYIQTRKVGASVSNMEDRIIYHDYDDIGNPLEISKVDGTHIVYIWGYNQTVPIAKIENATYSSIQGYVNNLQDLSNVDKDRTVDLINVDGSINYQGNEGSLRQALNALRTVNCTSGHKNCLEDALITTYTYDPLIGVTSITDPRKNVVYYYYDTFNRLKYVKDKDGNILSKNANNYKN